MCRVNSTYAIGASAMGVPGWPDSAFCTASIDSVRMVLMHSSSSDDATAVALVAGSDTAGLRRWEGSSGSGEFSPAGWESGLLQWDDARGVPAIQIGDSLH